MTTVRVMTDRKVGVGVRAEALSGALAWSDPAGPAGPLHRYWLVAAHYRYADTPTAELEILHLGPYFTGEGVFRLIGRWRQDHSVLH